MYMEILDDPKMATLPDRLWRRAIELFLVAGRTNDGGNIPDTAQIAWMLRMSTDDLTMDLRQIESVGIISRTPTGWMVNNFAKRQAAVGVAERVKSFREREQHAQYTGNENVTKRYTDTDTESDRDTEKEKEQNHNDVVVNIFKLYEHTVGILTPMMADELRQAEKDYPAEWLPEAFLLAEKANVRKWNYILAILKKWKTDGRGAPQHKAAKVTKFEPILE